MRTVRSNAAAPERIPQSASTDSRERQQSCLFAIPDLYNEVDALRLDNLTRATERVIDGILAADRDASTDGGEREKSMHDSGAHAGGSAPPWRSGVAGHVTSFHGLARASTLEWCQRAEVVVERPAVMAERGNDVLHRG